MSAKVRRDPLALVELAAVTEEATTSLRHDLRNKLSSMRSAGYYLRRRLSKTEAWSAEPRIDEMSLLLDADAVGANALLDVTGGGLYERRPAAVEVEACALEAVDCARVDHPGGFGVDAAPGRVKADRGELTLAIRCLVENAAEASGELVEIGGTVDGATYRLAVQDRGPGFDDGVAIAPYNTTKVGHAGLGLGMARRIAQRYGGRMLFEPRVDGAPGARVVLALPLHEEPAAT